MILVLCLNILNIYITKGMIDFSKEWLTRLIDHEQSYSCTDQAIKIDLDYLKSEYEHNDMVFFYIIIIANTLLIITTISQFSSHYYMMVRWYRENPLDGNEIARSI